MREGQPKVTGPTPDCAGAESGGFFSKARARLRCYARDVDAVLAYDPAARSRLEVVLTSAGLHAIWFHRVSHGLWNAGHVLAARSLSHMSRFLTGVEIHPGATIGQGVFIDHGMGIVIGETATIGDKCILYKGVVLGGTTQERGRRHPQVGKGVIIGSNACILGHISVGDAARIGSGSVVIRPVPESSTVVGIPGRVVRGSDERTRFDDVLDHASLPDPVAEMVRSLRDQNEKLKVRLSRVEEQLGVSGPSQAEEEDEALVDPALATRDLPPQHGG